MLGGEELYTHLWDHKPPGIYWAFMSAETVFGYGPSSILYMGIIFSLVALGFLYLFLKEIAGTSTALVGALFWTLASNSVSLQANLPNTELFMNAFIFIALWAFAKYHKENRGVFLFICGLAFALSSAFKTIAVFPLAALCLYVAVSTIRSEGRVPVKTLVQKFFLFLLPGAIVWAAISIYFITTGRFADFYYAVFEFNRSYSGSLTLNFWNYISTGEHILPIKVLNETLVLIFLSGLWLLFGRFERGGLGRSFFIFLILGVAAEIAAPGQYHPHYYQLMLPPVVIMSALFFSDLVSSPGFARYTQKVAFLLIFLFSLGYLLNYQLLYLKSTPLENHERKYQPGFHQNYKLGKYVKSITSPCETVYKIGSGSGVYYYSQRSSPVGVTFLFFLEHASPVVADRVITRIYDELSSSPPTIFIWDSRHGNLKETIFSDFVERNYNLIKWQGDFTFYEHKNREAAGGRSGCN